MTDKRIEVYDRDRREVVIDLGNGSLLVFPPPQAVQVAESLIHAATACGFRVEVQVKKYQVNNAMRAVLITRIAHVLRSLREKNTDNVRSAAAIVDTIIAEIC